MALDAQASHWSYGDTQSSGVYRVELGAPVSLEHEFAVNVDTSESDLTRAAADELPKEFVAHRREGLDGADLPAIGPASGLHKLLLYCALGLLFLETFLAWRFGGATQ